VPARRFFSLSPGQLLAEFDLSGLVRGAFALVFHDLGEGRLDALVFGTYPQQDRLFAWFAKLNPLQQTGERIVFQVPLSLCAFGAVHQIFIGHHREFEHFLDDGVRCPALLGYTRDIARRGKQHDAGDNHEPDRQPGVEPQLGTDIHDWFSLIRI